MGARGMLPFLYRCPNTGQTVQGLAAEEGPNAYEDHLSSSSISSIRQPAKCYHFKRKLHIREVVFHAEEKRKSD